MAYSIQREVSDGTLVLLDISISYIDRDEISVLFDGVVQVEGDTWDWVGTVDAKLSFTPAVGNGVEVAVVRQTDLSDLRHRFSEGAAFTANSMDEALEQVLHIAQESAEQLQGTDFYNDLDMHGYRVKNVGGGVDPGDAATVEQMTVHDATIVGYRDQTLLYRNEAEGFADDAEASAIIASTAADVAVDAHVALPDPHSQYVLAAEVQNSALVSSSAGGTADAITAAYTPAVVAWTKGMTLFVRAASANVTTTPTFTPNSGTLTAKTIVKGANGALVAGDIVGAGHWLMLQYDSTLDKVVLLNPATGVTQGLTQAQADARYCRIGYMLVQDQKANGTDGGSSSSGTQQRELNTVVANTIAGASLASNRITLPAGTYRVHGVSVNASGRVCKSWLYNVTDSIVAALGTSKSGYNENFYPAMSTDFDGRFTIEGPKVFEIRHYSSVAVATTGLGRATSSGQLEVYSTLEIIKES